MLHGGQQNSTDDVSDRHASWWRLALMARGLRRFARKNDLSLHLLQYRVRGWNGSDDPAPVRDARWALDRLQDRYPGVPVVLVGHSMGGMTVMSLAAHRPELFGPRVVGVVLVSTAAGRVAEAMLPLPVRATGLLTGRVVPRVTRVMTRRKDTLEATRRVGSDLAFSLIRRMGFGTSPSPAQVEFIERIIAATPIEVIAAYVPTFTTHDKYEALDVVGRVPTLVLVGDRDRVVPPAQSKELAARTPGSELVVFDGAGHMLTMERAALVNLHLRAFLRRVGRAARASRGA